jgi:PAS domain-containing protein
MRVLAGDDEAHAVIGYRHPDRGEAWVPSRSRAIRDEDGRLLMALTVSEDITARRREERNLRNVADTLQAAVLPEDLPVIPDAAAPPRRHGRPEPCAGRPPVPVGAARRWPGGVRRGDRDAARCIACGVQEAAIAHQGGRPYDDVALLVLRVPEEPLLQRRLPAVAESVRLARHALDELVDRFPRLDWDALRLVVGELVTNSIVHGAPRRSEQWFELTVTHPTAGVSSLRGRGLRACVRRPPARGRARGRVRTWHLPSRQPGRPLGHRPARSSVYLVRA